MIERFQLLIEDLRAQWEEWVWQGSLERRELASLRLAAHRLSIEKGYQSPYTDPDEYTSSWTPIRTLR